VSLDALRRIRTLKLPPGDKLTLMILTTYASRDGSNAFPSVRLLAAQSSCTDRAVQQRLARLRAAGYLEVQSPARQHRPTTYRVVVPKESRGERDFTPGMQSGTNGHSPLGVDAQSEMNGDSPLGVVRGESQASRGEPAFASEVNGGSPDQKRDLDSDQRRKSIAQLSTERSPEYQHDISADEIPEDAYYIRFD
jgi:hypothetical protein